jgi:hypothetical protein
MNFAIPCSFVLCVFYLTTLLYSWLKSPPAGALFWFLILLIARRRRFLGMGFSSIDPFHVLYLYTVMFSISTVFSCSGLGSDYTL